MKKQKEVNKTRREIIKEATLLTGGIIASTALSPLPTEASKKKTNKWVMILDLRRCLGCRACTVACKAEYNVPLGRWNAVIKEVDSGKYPETRRDFLPKMCNHCEGPGNSAKSIPPCVEKCPELNAGKRKKLDKIRYREGATYKRPDGMILFKNEYCIGCGKCIKACPYGARYFNPSVKLKRTDREGDLGIGKCTFCMHRVDKGIQPACVTTCPGDARNFGDLNDPKSKVSRLASEFNISINSGNDILLPHENTVPKVLYIDPKGVLKIYTFKNSEKEAEFRDMIT